MKLQSVNTNNFNMVSESVNKHLNKDLQADLPTSEIQPSKGGRRRLRKESEFAKISLFNNLKAETGTSAAKELLAVYEKYEKVTIPGAGDPTRTSPIQKACYYCDKESLKVLLKHGADINKKFNHHSPMGLFLTQRRLDQISIELVRECADMFTFMIENGAKIEGLDGSNNPFLFRACLLFAPLGNIGVNKIEFAIKNGILDKTAISETLRKALNHNFEYKNYQTNLVEMLLKYSKID